MKGEGDSGIRGRTDRSHTPTRVMREKKKLGKKGVSAPGFERISVREGEYADENRAKETLADLGKERSSPTGEDRM